MLERASAMRVPARAMQLSLRGGPVTLTVVDDGQGSIRRCRRREPHYGLTTMRERAETVGGAFHVASVLARAPRSRRTCRPRDQSRRHPIRVLLVDDHRIVREGMALVIDRQPDMRSSALAATRGRGGEALPPAPAGRDDHGPATREDERRDAIRAIRSLDPAARIVVLTMMRGDEDIYRALQAGAITYLLKDTAIEDLTRVIRDVHAGAPRGQPRGQGADRRPSRAAGPHRPGGPGPGTGEQRPAQS